MEGLPLTVRQARGQNIQRAHRPNHELNGASTQRRRRAAIDCETPSRDRFDDEQAPTRRPRPERHRKSDRRRREHRSDRLRKRSTSSSTITTTTTTSTSTSTSASTTQTEVVKNKQPPRVNPIFVWIRQEDTRIVDVRCEDYDKRNRILLTKTAHGWRAIPRTETLTTTLEDVQDNEPGNVTRHHHHEHRHERAKSGPGRPGRPRGRKNSKSGRKHRVEPRPEPAVADRSPVVPEVASRSPLAESDPWSRTVADIESHLPSHTITVPKRKRTRSLSQESECDEDTTTVRIEDSSNDIEEVIESASVNSGVVVAQALRTSPLDNLLAVAELEFNQEVRRSLTTSPSCTNQVTNAEIIETDPDNGLSVDCTVVECTDNEQSVQIVEEIVHDCDYNEDEDENQFSDVLDRLQQSLQSPIVISSDSADGQDDQEEQQEDNEEVVYVPEPIDEAHEKLMAELELVSLDKPDETDIVQEVDRIANEQQQEALDGEEEGEFYDSLREKSQKVVDQKNGCEQPTDLTITQQTVEDLLPTDLSTKSKKEPEPQPEVTPKETPHFTDDQPTDLSIRKHCNPSLTIEPIIRPPSQNSETIQSPQPSGIPAVPPSPDIYPITKQLNTKSIFLESLLSASPKLALNPELTITRNQKEPLDLGKGRKSASPTVTCSEEAKTMEPPPKRLKMEDITLKNLLHAEGKKPEISIKPIPSEKKTPNIEQSSRLLELLTADNIPDPMTQLKQLLADPHINIPDPMLVPKDRLSYIMVSPAKEITRLLMSRPELRLPEAFTHPNVMNDPDILVISMDQLKVIVEKNQQTLPQDSENTKPNVQKENKKQQPTEKVVHKEPKQNRQTKNNQADYQRYQQLMLQEQQMQQMKQNQMRKGLANDIDAATTAAFNQMMWLPYLNQLEAQAMATGNQQEFMKMLNTIFPPGGYPPVMPDHVPPMYNPRFNPPTHHFPIQPVDYNQGSLEFALWQEAMLRQKQEKTAQQNYRNEKNYQNRNKQQQQQQQEMNGHKQKNSNYENYMNLQFGHLPHLHPNLNPNLNLNNYNFGLPTADKYHFGSARTNQIQPEKIKTPMGPPLNKNHLQIPHFNQKTREARFNYPFLSKKEERLPRLPRIQNLPPSPKDVISNPQPIKTPGEPHTPIDLSRVKKFRDLEMSLFSFAKDDMEVGSTTEEMVSNQLENQTHHVWNPLFGK